MKKLSVLNIFITGTDTNVGKTYISCILLKLLNSLGFKTCAFKPIASGCKININNKLFNDDALLLQNHASIFLPYDIVNPIAFKEPMAPHLAAKKINFNLNKNIMLKIFQDSMQYGADINLFEGAGGWCVPLNNNELYADAIVALNIPVILVVEIKLGCLNHAILTYKTMQQMNANLIGWIANCKIKNLPEQNNIIETLRNYLLVPCLFIKPYNNNI